MLYRLLLPFAVSLAFVLAPAAFAKDLFGTVKIQQPDGLVPATGDGTLVFRVREPGKEVTSIETSVQAGQYRASLPEDCTFQVLATRTTEGAGYPLDGTRWLELPPDGNYDVIVRIPLDFHLQVYGTDGRTQLKDITVFAKLRKFARLELPGPPDLKTQLLFQKVESPIHFTVTEPEYYTYYVHAPGHAWTQISPDPYLGGVQTMQLPAGGDLDITLIQEAAGRGQVFRIRNLNPRPDVHPLVHELKQYPNHIEVVGLAVGQYHLSSEDPIRPSNMPIYGEMNIEIRAGETTVVEMPLKAEPVFHAVPAGGTVQLPAAWGPIESMTFRMNRLDPYGQWGRSFEIPGTSFKPVPGQAELYAWELPEVAPGAYNLSFQHTSYSVYREVNGDGHLRLDFSLPAPRKVDIVTVDDRTNEPLFPESLTWSAVEPEAIRKKIRDTAPFLSERRRLIRLGEDDSYSIYGPDAPLRVRLEDPRYDAAEWIVDTAGDCRVTWTIHRATAISITLLHGTEAVHWTGDARILSEDSGGKVTGARDLGRTTQFNLSGPGRYTVRFPTLHGFEDLPPQTVNVQDGEVIALQVELTPK